jgi:hypothetical protein
MYYVLEALIVGAYASLILTLAYVTIFQHLPMTTGTIALLTFIIGFLKHFIGYFMLTSAYCNFGYACKNKDCKYTYTYKNNIVNVFGESVLEGIVFLLVILCIVKLFDVDLVFPSLYIIVFIVAFKLHILAELAGLHTMFCKKCRLKNKDI